MNFENITLEKSDNVATIVLDRPPGSTLSLTLLPNLTAVFSEIESDSTVRVVLVTGSGERFFCAGADIRELRSIDAHDYSERGQALFRYIETLSKPVVPETVEPLIRKRVEYKKRIREMEEGPEREVWGLFSSSAYALGTD